MTPAETDSEPAGQVGKVWDVFVTFLRLGLTSFGGPVAHIAYFREAFVQRRRWLTEAAFADLVAICHVLPGPSSSQVGMAIGLQRAGLSGMFAAWFAFTMPSVVLIVLFALGANYVDYADGLIAGLKAVAVAVVAHAVVGMARSLGTGWRWVLLAVLAFVVTLGFPGAWMQVLVIVVAGGIGLWLLPRIALARDQQSFTVRLPRWLAVLSLTAFFVLLAGLPILANLAHNPVVSLVDGFYRAGALVFGGGHVVLPLLEAETVGQGLLGADSFLAGYGAAQALPGPLFTFSAYLGFVTGIPTELAGVLIALVAIFLPAMLLVVGVLPLWNRMRDSVRLRQALSGVNAGVVGLLAAAFVNPVANQGITSVATGVIAVIAVVALQWSKAPIWLIVLLAAGAGFVLL